MLLTMAAFAKTLLHGVVVIVVVLETVLTHNVAAIGVTATGFLIFFNQKKITLNLSYLFINLLNRFQTQTMRFHNCD